MANASGCRFLRWRVFPNRLSRRIELVSQHRSQLELLAPFAGLNVNVPALYVAGDRDLVMYFPGMDRLLPNLSNFVPKLRKTIVLPSCGHWTQQEQPAEVNAAMIEFLRGL